MDRKVPFICVLLFTSVVSSAGTPSDSSALFGVKDINHDIVLPPKPGTVSGVTGSTHHPNLPSDSATFSGVKGGYSNIAYSDFSGPLGDDANQNKPVYSPANTNSVVATSGAHGVSVSVSSNGGFASAFASSGSSSVSVSTGGNNYMPTGTFQKPSFTHHPHGAHGSNVFYTPSKNRRPLYVPVQTSTNGVYYNPAKNQRRPLYVPVKPSATGVYYTPSNKGQRRPVYVAVKPSTQSGVSYQSNSKIRRKYYVYYPNQYAPTIARAKPLAQRINKNSRHSKPVHHPVSHRSDHQNHGKPVASATRTPANFGYETKG